MDLLVTGGAGFIGSHLVRTVLADGYPALAGARVTVLDRLTYAGNRANLPDHPRLRLVVGDIRDAALVDTVLPGHDAIANVAAESHVDRSITAGADVAGTNVVGTQVLLDAAVRHGTLPAGRHRRGVRLHQHRPLGRVRPARPQLGVLGQQGRCRPARPRQPPHPRPARRGDPLRQHLRSAPACREADPPLRHPPARRPYGAPLLLDACGAGWDRVVHVADRPGHDRRYALDDTRIRSELGYAPRVDFTEGLAATVAWYRENRHWWGRTAATDTAADRPSPR